MADSGTMKIIERIKFMIEGDSDNGLFGFIIVMVCVCALATLFLTLT